MKHFLGSCKLLVTRTKKNPSVKSYYCIVHKMCAECFQKSTMLGHDRTPD